MSIASFRTKLRKDLAKIDAHAIASDTPAALSLFEQMVVVIEDRRFFRHPGVDVQSIARELWKALRRQRHGGASTIDMQFVRTTTNNRERTFSRKIYEAMLALMIQSRYSKRTILRSYLECAFFGTGLTGARAAADVVFGKALYQLTLDQAAFLAALLASPRPRAAPAAWESKVRRRAEYALSVYHSPAMQSFRSQYGAAVATPPPAASLGIKVRAPDRL